MWRSVPCTVFGTIHSNPSTLNNLLLFVWSCCMIRVHGVREGTWRKIVRPKMGMLHYELTDYAYTLQWHFLRGGFVMTLRSTMHKHIVIFLLLVPWERFKKHIRILVTWTCLKKLFLPEGHWVCLMIVTIASWFRKAHITLIIWFHNAQYTSAFLALSIHRPLTVVGTSFTKNMRVHNSCDLSHG